MENNWCTGVLGSWKELRMDIKLSRDFLFLIMLKVEILSNVFFSAAAFWNGGSFYEWFRSLKRFVA